MNILGCIVGSSPSLALHAPFKRTTNHRPRLHCYRNPYHHPFSSQQAVRRAGPQPLCAIRVFLADESSVSVRPVLLRATRGVAALAAKTQDYGGKCRIWVQCQGCFSATLQRVDERLLEQLSARVCVDKMAPRPSAPAIMAACCREGEQGGVDGEQGGVDGGGELQGVPFFPRTFLFSFSA